MYEADAFTIEVLGGNGRRTVRPAGDLDLATAPHLAAALEGPEAETAAEIVVDLAAVTFMDLTALTVLEEAARRAAGRGARLVVTGPGPEPARLLRLVEAQVEVRPD